MRLWLIAEAPGPKFIDTNGRRNKAVEKSLVQLPHRDWKNQSRLPSLKQLRYAAQLKKPWIEFEENDLPRIIKFLDRRHNDYVMKRLVKPAFMYLAYYFMNTGSTPPNELFKAVRSVFGPQGSYHDEADKAFISNYEMLLGQAEELDWRTPDTTPEDYYA